MTIFHRSFVKVNMARLRLYKAVVCSVQHWFAMVGCVKLSDSMYSEYELPMYGKRFMGLTALTEPEQKSFTL